MSTIKEQQQQQQQQQHHHLEHHPLEMQKKPVVAVKRISNVPSLVCAFSASSTTGGTVYAFGVFGDALKKSLQLSQTQLDVISATFFIAGLFSWIPGLVVDRMGMRFSMTVGGCSGALCTMCYWAVSRQSIATSNPVVALSILAVLICLSCGLIIGSIFKLCMMCGGTDHRGSAVGIAKGFVGLGAGIYATIFQAFRTSNESALDFLLLIAFFFVVCAALPACLLLSSSYQQQQQQGQTVLIVVDVETTPLHFRIMYTSLLLLGIVIVLSSLAEILDGDDDVVPNIRDYPKIGFILLIWLGPILSLLVLPRKRHRPSAKDEERLMLPPSMSTSGKMGEHDDTTTGGSQHDRATKDDIEQQEPASAKSEETTALLKKNYQTANDNDNDSISQAQHVKDESTPNLNLVQMLQTPAAWLMLWTTTILVGSGTYKTNNMGEMVEALEFPESVAPATLAIFSVSQAAARIVTGVMSEAALKWNVAPHGRSSNLCCNMENGGGIPRPFFLVIASSVAFVAHVMLAISTSQVAFVVGCTISASSFGMAWPLMVLIVGDVFGVENHGANYMFYDGFTKAVGTVVLSEYVAGNVYEDHVDTTDNPDELSCFGAACFRLTHIVVAVLSLTCIFASLALQFVTRRTYSNKMLRLHTN